MIPKLSNTDTGADKSPSTRFGVRPSVLHLRRGYAPGIAGLVAALALAGCGAGASHNAGNGAGSVADPNAVVVQVGQHAITKATFDHALATVATQDGPDAATPLPPEFTACVAQLKAKAAKSGSSAASVSTAKLKAECNQEYQGFAAQALDQLIVDQWTIGGAAEEGASVSEQAVRAAVEKDERAEPPLSRFERTLATSGRTVADFALETRVQLLGEGIRHALASKAGRITQAQVASYYNQHKSLYGIPQRRELEIARTGTAAEAQKVKREIASGKSFASVVSKLPLIQPIYSSDGVVPNYESGMYQEASLNQAILDAKLNVLSGPVHISLGYYVFAVKRILPAQQKTLAQSEATIRSQLPGELYQQSLATFIKNWRQSWTARTDCMPGYVVPKCRQFKAPAGSSAAQEDPYSLD